MSKPTFSERDTDEDWRLLAEADPHRAVLTRWSDERESREGLDDAFFETGARHIARIVTTIQRTIDPRFAPKTALDFGCGMGRLLAAMAPHVETLYGIDVAERMLALSAEQVSARTGKTPVLATSVEALGCPAHSLDWLNSYIVFQHIPPSRGMGILEELLALVASGGVISVHFTNWYGPMDDFVDASSVKQRLKGVMAWRHDGEALRILRYKDRFPPGKMQMYTYDLNELCALLAEHGFHALHMLPSHHNEIHGFSILSKRI